MKPVLIYQMGKVGSAAIRDSPNAIDVKNYQVHYLQPAAVNNLIKRHLDLGLKIPPHLIRSQEVLEKELLKEGGLKFITLFRDPVSRNVSAYFQNLQQYFPGVKDFSGLSSEELITNFEEKYAHNVSINWFDNEFKKSLEFDFLDEVVMPADSYQFELPNNNSLLALKVESDDERKVESIKKFLNLKSFELLKVNIGSEKSYAEEYKRFKSKIVISTEYLDKMYSSKFTRNLYTPNEIDSMRAKWER